MTSWHELDQIFETIPLEWRGHGYLSWPGRENGLLKARVCVELHHKYSSGGGPKVVAYGSNWSEALQAAAAMAREADSNTDTKSSVSVTDKDNPNG